MPHFGTIRHDEEFCDKVIDRLRTLLERATTEALADDPPEKTAVSLAVTLAQQIGSWVDRRAKLAQAAAVQRREADQLLPYVDLDRLESEFTQALEDLRCVRDIRDQMDQAQAL